MQNKDSQKTIIISGGGTGGHIFPALSIADALKSKHYNLLFFGAKDKMEMEKVPQAGYKIIGFKVIGLSRSLSFKTLRAFWYIFFAVLKSVYFILKIKPVAIVGTGGFASSPAIIGAFLTRIPFFIQEQNSFPGIINRIFGKWATKIFVSYPEMEKFFPKENIVFTGNPLRSIIKQKPNRKDALNFFELNNKKTMLIIGGSLGAKSINQCILENLELIQKNDLNIIWQTGENFHEKAKEKESKYLKVFKFIERMDYAYTAADFILSRSGAMAISEITYRNKPVIFVPFPYATEDHQAHNARMVEKIGGGVMVLEKDIEQLPNIIKEFSENEQKLKTFRQNIKKLARGNAVETIILEIESYVSKHS